MQTDKRWAAVVLTVAGLQLATCSRSVETAPHENPATVEHLDDGSDRSRITLTAKAAERLDIKTSPVREEEAGAAPRRSTVPYASVLYDPQGGAWVYTNPEPLVFLRHGISIENIDGDTALLSDGPPSGTEVVTVGAAELFGAEFEVGH